MMSVELQIRPYVTMLSKQDTVVPSLNPLQQPLRVNSKHMRR